MIRTEGKQHREVVVIDDDEVDHRPVGKKLANGSEEGSGNRRGAQEGEKTSRENKHSSSEKNNEKSLEVKKNDDEENNANPPSIDEDVKNMLLKHAEVVHDGKFKGILNLDGVWKAILTDPTGFVQVFGSYGFPELAVLMHECFSSLPLELSVDIRIMLLQRVMDDLTSIELLLDGIRKQGNSPQLNDELKSALIANLQRHEVELKKLMEYSGNVENQMDEMYRYYEMVHRGNVTPSGHMTQYYFPPQNLPPSFYGTYHPNMYPYGSFGMPQQNYFADSPLDARMYEATANFFNDNFNYPNLSQMQNLSMQHQDVNMQHQANMQPGIHQNMQDLHNMQNLQNMQAVAQLAGIGSQEQQPGSVQLVGKEDVNEPNVTPVRSRSQTIEEYMVWRCKPECPSIVL